MGCQPFQDGCNCVPHMIALIYYDDSLVGNLSYLNLSRNVLDCVNFVRGRTF